MSLEEKIAYDEAKLKAKTLIMSAKIQSIQNDLESSSKNPQSLWKNFNSLLHRHKRQQPSSDECCVVQFSNNYFLNKVQNRHKLFFHQHQFKQLPHSSNRINSIQNLTPCDMKKLSKISARKYHHSTDYFTKFS